MNFYKIIGYYDNGSTTLANLHEIVFANSEDEAILTLKKDKKLTRIDFVEQVSKAVADEANERAAKLAHLNNLIKS
jgi:hypothetical protein